MRYVIFDNTAVLGFGVHPVEGHLVWLADPVPVDALVRANLVHMQHEKPLPDKRNGLVSWDKTAVHPNWVGNLQVRAPWLLQGHAPEVENAIVEAWILFDYSDVEVHSLTQIVFGP